MLFLKNKRIVDRTAFTKAKSVHWNDQSYQGRPVDRYLTDLVKETDGIKSGASCGQYWHDNGVSVGNAPAEDKISNVSVYYTVDKNVNVIIYHLVKISLLG